jgi:predicted HTH domain antitoxin
MPRWSKPMPLVISDEILKQAKLSERDALIEFACRLFDAGRLSLGHAGKIVGLTEREMEDELAKRDVPRYRYTEDMFDQDLQTLTKLERWRHEDRHQ